MLQYQIIGAVATQAAVQQQNIMDPPSVAGWPAYYQSPDFYKQWINSVTLPNRYGYTDTILYGAALKFRQILLSIPLPLSRNTAKSPVIPSTGKRVPVPCLCLRILSPMKK
jgi:hypothetical protein